MKTFKNIILGITASLATTAALAQPQNRTPLPEEQKPYKHIIHLIDTPEEHTKFQEQLASDKRINDKIQDYHEKSIQYDRELSQHYSASSKHPKKIYKKKIHLGEKQAALHKEKAESLIKFVKEILKNNPISQGEYDVIIEKYQQNYER